MTRLSFIGMSGAGKSYWTRKLALSGFSAIGIDDRIEGKLAPDLAAGSHRGIGGVAAWMGWPDQPDYRRHEKRYLACEIESMGEALNEIENSPNQNIVLDTTGSVIYAGEEISARLKRLTTVIYLAASPEEQKLLIARYVSDPKPVLWGDQFTQRPNESAAEAVARCYPQLIAQRKKLYESLADRVVFMSNLRSAAPDELTASEFLELLHTPARSAG